MKVAFLTLGCKVNFYETEKMKAAFEASGHRIVGFEEDADVYIVNTCTVTNIADRKSRKMLHRAKRKNPAAFVVAAGCYADALKKEKDMEEGIDLLVSNQDKPDILNIVEKKMEARVQEQGLCASEQEMPFVDTDVFKESRTRAFLNVQNGCNQYCTYCIIPYVRGALTSKTEEEVLLEVEALAERGMLEVVLTGIHLSSYGVDLSGKNNFLELEGKPLLHLVRKIAEIEGIQRIRLGSLEPRIITEAFARELSEIKKVCPQFHLSLQSGCDTVLKRMNRHYTAEEYLEKTELLRTFFTEPAITTDIIVGFPGEDEEEFQTTVDFVEKAGFSKAHIFKYSRRKGTMADAMSGQLTEKEKDRRSREIIKKEQKMEIIYRKKFLNKEQKVLFEEIILKDEEEYLVGYTERYVRIGVKVSDRAIAVKRINTIGTVWIPEQEILSGDMLYGELV